MTCREFKRCVNYRVDCYECDHTGEDCKRFSEKCLFLVFTT